jgi:hypothetical protein
MVVSVILPCKRHAVVADTQQPIVGDSNSMSVAREEPLVLPACGGHPVGAVAASNPFRVPRKGLAKQTMSPFLFANLLS